MIFTSLINLLTDWFQSNSGTKEEKEIELQGKGKQILDDSKLSYYLSLIIEQI